jgi:hypothetical protein
MNNLKPRYSNDVPIKEECPMMDQVFVDVDLEMTVKQENGDYLHSESFDNDGHIKAECGLMHDTERRLKCVKYFKEELLFTNENEIAMNCHPEQTDMVTEDVKDCTRASIQRQDCKPFVSSEMEGDSAPVLANRTVLVALGNIKQSVCSFTVSYHRL